MITAAHMAAVIFLIKNFVRRLFFVDLQSISEG